MKKLLIQTGLLRLQQRGLKQVTDRQRNALSSLIHFLHAVIRQSELYIGM